MYQEPLADAWLASSDFPGAFHSKISDSILLLYLKPQKAVNDELAQTNNNLMEVSVSETCL